MSDGTMLQGAIAMHEMYLSLKAAGFTRRESLVLVSCMVLNRPLDP